MQAGVMSSSDVAQLVSKKPTPQLPPTEYRDGKRVIVTTKRIMVTQERLVEVVEVPQEFIDELARLEKSKERWRFFSVFGSLFLGLLLGVIAGVGMLVIASSPLYAFGFGCFVYLVVALGIAYFVTFNKVDRMYDSIRDHYKKYGLEPNVGKVYTGPESYRYSDVVYVSKD